MARAGARAGALKLGQVGIEVMALRALALDRKGEEGRPLLLEAMNLAQIYGLARTFIDGHPAVADWARSVAEEEARGADVAPVVPVPRIVSPSTERSATGPPTANPPSVLANDT